jgi:hypothetical protein
MSTRDSGVIANPNLIAPPRAKGGGLSDKIRDPPYLTPAEAAFIAEKRREGVPDVAIARMLGTRVERIRKNVVVAEFGDRVRSEDPDFGIAPTEAEKARRREEARRMRVWRPAAK